MLFLPDRTEPAASDGVNPRSEAGLSLAFALHGVFFYWRTNGPTNEGEQPLSPMNGSILHLSARYTRPDPSTVRYRIDDPEEQSGSNEGGHKCPDDTSTTQPKDAKNGSPDEATYKSNEDIAQNP